MIEEIRKIIDTAYAKTVKILHENKNELEILAEGLLEYETLSGFVMTSLGRVPQAADNFEWNNFRFEVMDMDGRRVDKVLVTTLPKPPTAQA